MNKPLVTIIIPCYNCSKTLEQAFNSCFEQGIEELEVVMVDDCSTDDTRELMKKLKSSRANVELFFHEQNRGGGAARNTAVKNSSSDVIFCLDSDDILPAGTIKKMYSMLISKNADAVGIHRSIKFKGDDIKKISHINTFGYAGEIIPFESLIEKPEGLFCSLYSTFMFTKQAFAIAGGYPENHGFDTQSFAWKFLANGLRAYTCPDAEYLHRIHFNKSYYIREYESGKINHNWFKIYEQFLYLFNTDTQIEILNFNLNDSVGLISDFLIKKNNIFKTNYSDYIRYDSIHEYEKLLSSQQNISIGDRYWLGVRKFDNGAYEEAFKIFEKLVQDGLDTGHVHYYLKVSAERSRQSTLLINEQKIKELFSYRKQGSQVNIIVRILRKVFRVAKKKIVRLYFLRKNYYHLIGVKNNIRQFLMEKKSYADYYKKIEGIKKNKEIILEMDWGGLGDALVYSSLPRVLKEEFDVNFYLSEKTRSVFRNNDIFRLCFEMNPHFKGFKNGEVFRYRRFSRDRSFINQFSDLFGKNIIEDLYTQFGISKKPLPEIYYKPNYLPEYSEVVLADLNFISGHKLGWVYNAKKINDFIKFLSENKHRIQHVEPQKQDIFRYVDMIYSSKEFVTVLSGGAAVTAAINKKAHVFLPQNVSGESVYNFTFKNSSIIYKQ